MVGEDVKSKKSIASSLIEGDIVNGSIFIRHEGFDVNKIGGQYIRIGKFKCKYCGNEFITRIAAIKSGHTSSCGCYNKKRVLETNTTHDLSKSPLYFTWDRMIRRCNQENSQDYYNYGARGISVCEEWKNDIFSFITWANKNGYKKGLSIERIDNDGNYCPENCKWATMKEQSRNRRSTRIFEYDGRLMSMAEYCELANVSYSAISKRVTDLNWSIERAINTKVRSHKK